MAIVANLMVKISANSSQMQKELKAVQRNIKSAFGSEAIQLSQNVLNKVKLLTVGFAALGIASVKMAANMEQTSVAFKTLLGSGEAAEKMIKNLVNFAARTPFTLDGVTKSSQMMLAYGFQAEAVIPILRSVGDATSSLGGNSETMQSIIRALGQIQQKGKLSAEEMRQLAEQGIGAWQYVADSMGITVAKAQELASKGAIGSGEAIKAIVLGMHQNFQGGMEAQSKTVNGMLSTIADNSMAVARVIGKNISSGLDLSDNLSRFSEFLSNFAIVAEQSGVGEAIRQLVPDELKITIVAIAGAITGILVPALASAAIATLAATWPLLAIGAACAAAAVLIYENWDGIKEFFINLWDGVIEIFDKAMAAITKATDGVASAWSKLKAKLGVGDKPATRGVSGTWDVADPSTHEQAVATATETTVTVDVDANTSKAKGKIKDTVDSIKTELEDVLSNLAPGAVGEDKASVATAKKAAKAYEQLKKEAESTSKSIERAWLEMNGAQQEILASWYADQVAELDKSKTVNSNYQRDRVRLEETYQEKLRQLLSREAKERQDTIKTITDSYRDMYDKLNEMGMKGSSGDIFKLEKAASDDVKAASDQFAKLTADYTAATAAQKKNILDGLNEAGVAFKVTAQDSLDFSSELAQYEAQRFMQLQDDKVAYYRQAKDIQADIDEAYNQLSLSKLKSVLTQENAVRLNALESQKAMMDTYQEAMLASMQTTADLSANMYGGVFDGLKSSISDVITGVSSIGEAFTALGETLLQVVADWIAQKIAGMLTVALFEEELLGTAMTNEIAKEEALAAVRAGAIAQETAQTVASIAQTSAAQTAAENAILATGLTALQAFTAASLAAGAAVAAAWAAAAANVSLASFGSNAGPAMAGISSTHALTKTLSIPQLASGGLATGPTLAEIGEGKYDEAVTPLNDKVFKRLADGISEAGGGGQTTVNVYGDINGASDEERIFSGLFDGMRGAMMGGY